MPRIAFWRWLVALLVAATFILIWQVAERRSARADSAYLLPGKQEPVDVLRKNLETCVTEHPDDAKGYYRFAAAGSSPAP